MRSLSRFAGPDGRRLDVAIAVGFTTLALIELAGSPTFDGLVSFRLILFVMMQTGLLAFRRRFPLTVHLIASLGLALQVNSYPRGISTDATLITLYSATAYARIPAAALAVAVTTTDVYWVVSRFDGFGAWDLLNPMVTWAGVAVLGFFSRFQQIQTERRIRRLAEFEAERASLRQRAIAEERGRMAQELHDAVGHSVTGIVLLAGALRDEEDQPAHVRTAIDAIERSGSDAMAELDALIGVLRNDGADDELDHQPTLENLHRLFSNAEAMGLDVVADVQAPDHLAPVIDRAAFRIIQESLTNAAKYANPGEVTVAVRPTVDSIEIEVRNPTKSDPPTTILSGGQGLIGMNERLSVLGGTLEAGPMGQGEFRLLAILPLDARSTI